MAEMTITKEPEIKVTPADDDMTTAHSDSVNSSEELQLPSIDNLLSQNISLNDETVDIANYSFVNSNSNFNNNNFTSPRRMSYRPRNSLLQSLALINTTNMGIDNGLDGNESEWSKQSLDQFFNPLESFLDVQLRRERSSKRRCREVVRKRELDQQRMFVETKLREFDEKINLNVLLKRRTELKERKSEQTTTSGASNTNHLNKFRQHEHPPSHCSRFKIKFYLIKYSLIQ